MMTKKEIKMWLERLKERRKWKGVSEESKILLEEKIWIIEKVLE